MSLLPISQEDLKLCAQRWGWNMPTEQYASNDKSNEFYPDGFDSENAAAILDRENWLLRKTFRFCIAVPGKTAWVEDRHFHVLATVDFHQIGLESPQLQVLALGPTDARFATGGVEMNCKVKYSSGYKFHPVKLNGVDCEFVSKEDRAVCYIHRVEGGFRLYATWLGAVLDTGGMETQRSRKALMKLLEEVWK